MKKINLLKYINNFNILCKLYYLLIIFLKNKCKMKDLILLTIHLMKI